MSEPLCSESRDGVRVLQMRFGRANALSPTVIERLGSSLSNIDGPIVLTGDDKVFSAGLDLLSVGELGRSEMEAFLERFSAFMVQVLTHRTPLVAAINGHAVAGGCILAMACDYRVGVEGSYKLGINELALGLPLPAVGLEILRGSLPRSAARRVVLGSQLHDPRGAAELGLLDELAPDRPAAVDRACDVARSLNIAPAEFAVMKSAFVAPIVQCFRSSRQSLDYRFLESWFSDSARQRRSEIISGLRSKNQ